MNRLRIIPLAVAVLVLVLFSCRGTEHLEGGRWEGMVILDGESYFFFLEGEQKDWTVSFPELLISRSPVTDVVIRNDTLSFSVWLVTGELRFSLERNESSYFGKSLFQGISGSAELHSSNFTRTFKQEHQPCREGTEVSVQGAKGLLYATYLVPEGSNQFPCILLISGSGPTDRDGNSEYVAANNNIMLHLAAFLQSKGIATVRYDKYGVGASFPEGGIDKSYTFDDAVHDAAAWVEFMEQQPEIFSYGIIGHSEGSLTGILASQLSSPDIFISLAGNGDPIDVQLVKQVSRMQKESALVMQKQLESISQGLPVVSSGDVITDTILPLESVSYLRSWMKYSPAEELKKLKTHIVVLHGRRDLQVLEEDNSLLVEESPHARRYVIEGMNHMLRNAQTDELAWASYRDGDMPLHEQLLIIIAEEISIIWEEISL